jgi:hypothetical protein
MKRARVGIIAAAIFAVASVAFAQKPNFSGTWTLDPEASGMAAPGGAPRGGAPGGAPGGPPGGMPGGMRGGGALGNGQSTVTQTADTLTIERTMGDNRVTIVYKLDGTETKNTMTRPDGARMESVSVARLDGNKLVIKTKQDMRGQMVESTQTWTLAGNVLTIENTNVRGAQKRVYKKSS